MRFCYRVGYFCLGLHIFLVLTRPFGSEFFFMEPVHDRSMQMWIIGLKREQPGLEPSVRTVGEFLVWEDHPSSDDPLGIPLWAC